MRYSVSLKIGLPVESMKKAVAPVLAPFKHLVRFQVSALITAAALLTAGDILLTYIGLRYGYLIELNPLMNHLLQSGYGIYVLPVYLFLCFAALYHYAGAVRWLAGAMSVMVALKAVIMIQHLAILFKVFA